ncbi:MAG: arginine--tRNA ligase [Kiritimatiellae bacterium]|jgi:arginyl-tRNA synthetase|nr:arginine--tRNA ligase [Kiritimatiellia bacterium]
MINKCEMQLLEWIKAAFEKAFGSEHDWSWLQVQPASDKQFGDFQCSDAMQAARTLRMAPRAIAEAAVAALPLPETLTKVEVAGPGFINLTVNKEWLSSQVESLAATDNFGIPNVGKGSTVVIDYSSPNVAKPMHIGHIRSTVIGAAIDRIYRALGYKVIADNHMGDWGTQFGIMIKGYRTCLTEEERENLTVDLLERAYVASYNKTKDEEGWIDECRAELVKLQQGDPENRAVWKRFIEISLDEFNRVYKRLDVSFDLYRGESYYHDMLAETIQLLEEKGLAEESEGALVVKLEDEGMPVCIVRKSDGGFNYATTDIATVRSRIADFKPDKIVYVTDERQQLHFKQFFTVCNKLGCETKLEHVWFGLMRLPEGTFSTREGNVIKLEVLLDEAERRALEIIKSAGRDLSEEEQKKLAAQIGISAIKYADLSHDPQTLITFTWEKALALDGNSGPYLQYAYARMCSLLDKYADRVENTAPLNNKLLLDTPVERELVLKLLQFPGTVLRASEAYKPSILADYLFTLAQLYSRFYQSSPVLKADDDVRDSRIKLCAMAAKAMNEGMTLLGLSTPRRI